MSTTLPARWCCYLGIVLCLLDPSVATKATAQTNEFQNLDFEQTQVVPTLSGSVLIDPVLAFPFWTLSLAPRTNGPAYPLMAAYNFMPLEGALAVLVGPNPPDWISLRPMQGSYSVCLVRSFDESEWIPQFSQTGSVPVDATLINLLGSIETLALNGTQIPLFKLGDRLLGDVSAFAGQVVELTLQGYGYFDDIQFSSTFIPELVQLSYGTNNGQITVIGYSGLGKAVVIPDTLNGLPVTSIQARAFAACTMSSVTVPDSVVAIGDGAFSGCPCLRQAKLPQGLTQLRQSTFSDCVSLTNVVLPDSITNVGASAFALCRSLSDLIIPNGVRNIGDDAFNGCTALQQVRLPQGLTQVRLSTFNGCVSLTNVVLPDSITNIGGSAFALCRSLSDLTIPNGVTSFEDFAFANCRSLSHIFIPESVTSIGSGVFQGCAGLTNLTVPDSVTYIGETSTFSDCRNLRSITLPSTLTRIGPEAFSGCDSLQSITIPERVRTIGANAFYMCRSLTSVVIPDGVTSIERWSFHFCQTLTNLTLSRNITRIGHDAFGDCRSLSSIIIPGTVSSLEDWAFRGCSRLTALYFEGNAPTTTSTILYGSTNATVYYLPGTTGWGVTFGGRPTALWRPALQSNGERFGVQTNQFGFNITWASGKKVVVEGNTDLTNPSWSPISTNTLASGTAYFSDTMWTKYPERFYRVRAP